MTKHREGYHQASTYLSSLVEEMAKLPVGWRCRDGLKYPLTIRKTSGLEFTFYTYEEHHKFISNLFKTS